MRYLLATVAAAAAAVCSGAASAAWHQAKSKHFIIYADDNPNRLREFATRLERFDQAARVALDLIDPPVGDGNRLTIFVMPSPAEVRSIIGDKSGFLRGFYTGRVAGSLAYVAKSSSDMEWLGRDTILFHEYTHHLMNQNLDRPYPDWYVEGFAEFFATPKFDKDGSVWFGGPAQHRAWGLFNGPQMPVETLLAGLQPNFTVQQREVFYGRGWLLTHYLLMDPQRKGQLNRYFVALARGAPPHDAALEAFGDLKQLDKDLDRYRSKPFFQGKVEAANLRLGPIEVQPLSQGAAQVILARARLKHGSAKETAEALAAQVRQVQGRFPGDELGETTLAEAELKTGHPQAAEAAADRALKANPRNTEAMVLKGRAIADRAEESDGDARDALFEQARKVLIAANKLDTEDPEPLYEYFRTYQRQGERPTPNALAALHYASDLAPQDLGVRMTSAVAYLNEGKLKDARATLAVVAYSPHLEAMGAAARRMIADIDAGNAKAALQNARPGASQQSSSN